MTRPKQAEVEAACASALVLCSDPASETPAPGVAQRTSAAAPGPTSALITAPPLEGSAPEVVTVAAPLAAAPAASALAPAEVNALPVLAEREVSPPVIVEPDACALWVRWVDAAGNAERILEVGPAGASARFDPS